MFEWRLITLKENMVWGFFPLLCKLTLEPGRVHSFSLTVWVLVFPCPCWNVLTVEFLSLIYKYKRFFYCIQASSPSHMCQKRGTSVNDAGARGGTGKVSEPVAGGVSTGFCSLSSCSCFRNCHKVGGSKSPSKDSGC